jgi:hypothetical protein
MRCLAILQQQSHPSETATNDEEYLNRLQYRIFSELVEKEDGYDVFLADDDW